ncbi:dTDP-4-dehydrorhamnose reductase [Saccharibacillus alkalitolerans]|uniref:dTDP-4-dehydrorhamnose reductase n=1 Tax=Saccharibacillus alkalitolerans TaxID=2705290 RepID=A0ABX0F918_9BACL|nr:dTDP-4-dehydrorhamnose reductase [Saccharibacillus alkalitolerans]NGZ76053.1 dTDP-4-dehydrorhamnose reductase [Saccharibacillus alkalitolerans]
MKVLVTGAKGQLGQDVVRLLGEAGHEVKGCDRADMDITDQQQCEEVIGGYRPEAVIHCAAYTAVDAAEEDADGAYRINAAGTRNIAAAAEKVGARLVYISTDYVFDGQAERPYREYDNTAPQTVYGESKRAGEVLAQSLNSKTFIVRTSWVYGQHGGNFVKTMLKLGAEKESLSVVHDQIGSPTYTVDLARFLLQLIQTEKYGVYHASNSGQCSWHEFAQAIFETAGLQVNVLPVTTEQFPRPAKRPAYSVMDHTAIRANDLEDLPHWRDGLERFLAQVK